MSPPRIAPRRAAAGLPRGLRLTGGLRRTGVGAASSPWKAPSRGNRGARGDRTTGARSGRSDSPGTSKTLARFPLSPPAHLEAGQPIPGSQNQRSFQSLRPAHGIPDSLAEQLPELLEEASREDLTPVRFLERLVEREYETKEERRIEMWWRMSGLPPGKTLDCFDWSFQPRADRAKMEELATSEFARRAENVLFLGPPGVGRATSRRLWG